MDKPEKRPFEEVYDEYYEKVFKSVYVRLLHMENTEDIVQDTFVKAMKAYDRYDPKEKDIMESLLFVFRLQVYAAFFINPVEFSGLMRIILCRHQLLETKTLSSL